MNNVTYPVTNSSLDSLILRFTWIDYMLFCLIFGSSLGIGIYFGCFRNKKASTFEYLLASRSLYTLPVAMSLIASHLSGITILGGPTDVYFHGTQYWASMFAGPIFSVLTAWIYLPVFYELKVNSTYEYLKLRFGNGIRTIALMTYIFDIVLYLPILVYIPALTFSQVSGIGIMQIASIICVICIFYTTIGGLRGVVWNDALQFTVTIISLFVVFIHGVISEGGFSEIWGKAERGNRIEFFNLNTDPTVRSTLWGTTIGASIFWIACLGVNPATVQRLLAVPSPEKAKMCMYIFGMGATMVTCITSFMGIMIFARYHECDPYSAKIITQLDQIFPYYVMDTARDIPGLSGIFLTGVFCTALSTMSTHLNTASGTIYTEFLNVYLPGQRTDAVANTIIKATAIMFGLLSIAMIFVVERLGGVLEICISFAGITSGPLLGLFTMGMMLPSVNSKGATIGAITGLCIMVWIVSGNVLSVLNRSLTYEFLPLKTSGCPHVNSSLSLNLTSFEHSNNLQPFWIHKISFYWFTPIGAIITIVVGLISSKIFSEEIPTNKNLYNPIIQRYLKEERAEVVERKSLKNEENIVMR